LEIAKKLRYDTSISNFILSDIHNADEIFLTGTAAEVEPVIEIDSRKIGDGKPGKITMQIKEEYKKLVNSTGTPIYE
ncbi:MAG: branched-chain amino acid aminotransferase, partial [Candidatus Thermoplasmatota archaeon]|nr:branched-chain amino acid aminotransferase [Candidatus Thermoplasmatota archaeon]